MFSDNYSLVVSNRSLIEKIADWCMFSGIKGRKGEWDGISLMLRKHPIY